MAGKKMQLSVAQEMVNTYKNGCSATDVNSFLIDAQYIRSIIDQPGCDYVRIFMAVEGVLPISDIGLLQGHTLVLVGADSKKANMTKGEDDSEVYEQLDKCPPYCTGDEGTIL